MGKLVVMESSKKMIVVMVVVIVYSIVLHLDVYVSIVNTIPESAAASRAVPGQV